MNSIYVVDADGRTIVVAKVVTDPAGIRDVMAEADGAFGQIGFEAGPLSQWLHNGLTSTGLPAVRIGARQGNSAMSVLSRKKNDRNDARSLAQLIRSGWFKAAHVKSTESQEIQRQTSPALAPSASATCAFRRRAIMSSGVNLFRAIPTLVQPLDHYQQTGCSEGGWLEQAPSSFYSHGFHIYRGCTL